MLEPAPSEKRPAISVQNLEMKFASVSGVVTAIDGLTFDVHAQEFVSLVGPSGCGKSTCLGLIAGLKQPTRGEIRINGRRIDGPNRNVGFMLQKDLLMPWRTVINNVLFGLEIRGTAGDEAKKRALTYLDRFGLSEFANRYPSDLSGGMRQRVALIRTLIVNPDIILLDEPFGALDFQIRLLLANELWRILSEENKTVLLITHDIAEAVSMSDRVLVMGKRPGRIKQIVKAGLARVCNSPLDARKAPTFDQLFAQVWEQLDVDIQL